MDENKKICSYFKPFVMKYIRSPLNCIKNGEYINKTVC